ncbi:MAG TPA: serine hydrolase domain-containing protein [Thermoanaerobaculia bacterium]|jgi:CubicO group peptidase (beta-lactamase class C family)|nr:serine hydrolase domain-containing protein [Thermoanaerobaculia bacterium]
MRTALVRPAIVSLLAASLAAPLAAAPDAPDKSKPADTKSRVDAVFAEYDRSDSPGCALGVFRDGRVAYARGYGMANLELGIANSPQSVLDIGSTGKQFTAFSIQLLASEGKLSLDDDIRKWVPEIPDYGKTITIRHLLHHTGGLRDYLELFSLQGVEEEDLSTREDALAVLALQKAPNFAPGEEHLYSNTGYFLLGEIVRRASGKSLRDFAAERIFGPLGMRHTQYNDLHTRIIPGRATGYAKADGGGFGIEMSDWEQVGDGGVQTSVEDLQKWDENFFTGTVGGFAVLAAMLEPGVLNSGKKIQYASALYVTEYRGLPAIEHGGAWAGYRAQLLRFPKQHFSVACICNLAQANPSRLAHRVAEVYLGDLMKKEPDEAAAGNGSGAKKTPAAADASRLQALIGSYLDRQNDRFLRLTVEDGQLRGRLGSRALTFVPTAADRFRVEGISGVKAEARVEKSGGARPRLAVTLDEDGDVENWSFEPVDAWSPSPADLAALAGRYTSRELDTTWRLEIVDGKLYVRHRGGPEEPLSPTVADRMTVAGRVLRFTRDASGKAAGFIVDEGRVRGIAFQRMSGS